MYSFFTFFICLKNLAGHIEPHGCLTLARGPPPPRIDNYTGLNKPIFYLEKMEKRIGGCAQLHQVWEAPDQGQSLLTVVDVNNGHFG